ncbi:MAG: UDP-N-acetylmuramate dehydrogenase [Bacteroidetes bacterium]|nr:UDP-N-acetylmuramate dehydrogenase [Bacteroidota bacterium]
MKIHENISLKPFTTFGIDKKAKFFVRVGSMIELKSAFLVAKEKRIPVLILGGGSNILLTQDVEGLVIKLEIKGIQVVKEEAHHLWIEVGAGEVWHDLVLHCIDKDWAGLENLSLIPGTVGASPMQNIGAYGVELKDVFHSLQAMNRETLEVHSFDSEACQFGYRESIFKQTLKNQYVITSVTFHLSKAPEFHLEYGAIKEVLQANGIQHPSLREVSEAVIQIRQSKLPDPKEIGNAGSFFKNPTISSNQFEELRALHPTLPGYSNPEGVKVAAGWLIEQAGWKGKRIGHVGVHAKQALVLVNYGEGSGEDIKQLSQQIQTSVFDKFGIQLQPEVNFI